MVEPTFQHLTAVFYAPTLSVDLAAGTLQKAVTVDMYGFVFENSSSLWENAALDY